MIENKVGKDLKLKYSQRCIIGQEVNRSRRAPNLPQLLLLNTPPSPPTGFPRAQLAWGGGLVSRPGGWGGCSVQDPTEIYLQLNFLASLPVGRIRQTEVLQLQEKNVQKSDKSERSANRQFGRICICLDFFFCKTITQEGIMRSHFLLLYHLTSKT